MKNDIDGLVAIIGELNQHLTTLRGKRKIEPNNKKLANEIKTTRRELAELEDLLEAIQEEQEAAQ